MLSSPFGPSPKHSKAPLIEWPLLLKVRCTKDGAYTNSWGTGFLVQREEIPPKPTLPIKEEKLPEEELQRRGEAMVQERKRQDIEWKLKFKRPDLHSALVAHQTDKEAKEQHFDDNELQDQKNWKLGHQEGSHLWLVTNEHVLRPNNHYASQITIYFRPRHGTGYNTVTLDIPAPPPPQWYTTVPIDCEDPGNKPKDVAVLPLTMVKGKARVCPQWNPAPDVLHRIPKCPGGAAQVLDRVQCAGFPLLSGDEQGKWDYRHPAVLEGNVVAVYPPLQQFRVAMSLMWGMSGSLVFRYNRDKGEIDPLGVFSHIKFTGGASQFDSSIRVVWDWSLVESLVGVRDETKRVVVVAV